MVTGNVTVPCDKPERLTSYRPSVGSMRVIAFELPEEVINHSRPIARAQVDRQG
jgi:hypothetical protein